MSRLRRGSPEPTVTTPPGFGGTARLMGAMLGTVAFAAVVAWGAGCSGGGSCATGACGGTGGADVPLGIVLPAGGDWVDSLAIGPDGNVWFTDCHDSRIGKVTTVGEVTEYPTPSACIVEEGVDGIA